MTATIRPTGDSSVAVRNAVYTEDPASGVFRLNPRVYTDSNLLDHEMREVFGKSWIYVGHVSETPTRNSFITRKVAGRPIVMVRGEDDEIRIFLNICRHRGNVICRERKGTAKRMMCSYHAWTYDTSGKLVGVTRPGGYAPGFNMRDMDLFQVRTEIYRGLVFLSFNAEMMGLVDYLAGAREILDLILDSSEDEGDIGIVGGAHDYGVDANWKLLMENTMDIYHVFSTHNRYVADFLPNVMNQRPTPSGMFDQSLAMDLGNGHVNIETTTFGGPGVDADKQAKWEAKYGVERADRMLNRRQQLLLFPNTLFLQTWQAIRTCQPVAHNKMEVTAWALMPLNEAPQPRATRLALYNSFLGPAGFATPDDIDILETLQENMTNAPELTFVDMSRGMGREQPLCDDELQMRGFWREWSRRMEPSVRAEAGR